ncbi:MAG: amidase domain-containing protein [Caldisericum sp.]|uniref:amidase domain-containing protein n=1 Tax=Caldisericum sp. TaxID=2499687 RepID=UPI003D1501BB
MKKGLVVCLVILFLLTTFASIQKGYSKNTLSVKDSSINTSVATDEITNILKAWIIKNEAQYYKNISVATTPVKVEVKDSKIEGIFTVTVSEMLKATNPEELPAIRGMERFRNLKKGELSPSQNNAVNKELTSWVTELKGYIGKTETLNIDFKVVADLSESGSILPETVNFLAENSMGDFYKIYSLVPTADEMEEEGFSHAKEIADKAKNAVLNSFVVDTYRRCDLDHPPLPQPGDPPNTRYYTSYNDYYNYAANYADSFALSYNSQYASCRNDCANFVSQAMYAGGIPMDTTPYVTNWWCNPPNPPMDYSPWVWTTPVSQNYYTGLRDYMINRGHWESSNITWANAGSVIMWKDTSDYPGHVAMIVQNDTINRALSQHNNDRRHYLYTTTGYYSYSCDFYTVHNYVSFYSLSMLDGTTK